MSKTSSILNFGPKMSQFTHFSGVKFGNPTGEKDLPNSMSADSIHFCLYIVQLRNKSRRRYLLSPMTPWDPPYAPINPLGHPRPPGIDPLGPPDTPFDPLGPGWLTLWPLWTPWCPPWSPGTPWTSPRDSFNVPIDTLGPHNVPFDPLGPLARPRLPPKTYPLIPFVHLNHPLFKSISSESMDQNQVSSWGPVYYLSGPDSVWGHSAMFRCHQRELLVFVFQESA